MKQIKIISILLFFSGLMVLYNGCKEECPCDDPTDPVCENYDPCYGRREINTRFIMNNGYNGWAPPPDWCLDRMVYSDTFSTTNVRFFVPKGNENSTYEWQIGTDERIRTEDEFELDFEDYIDQNGLNISIPITLTIRTPLNDCMKDPADTLIVVTRELYFTDEEYIGGILPWSDKFVYEGHFTSSPGETTRLEFYGVDPISDSVSFGGRVPRYNLIIGLPIADTILIPKTGFGICGILEGCGNKVYSYRRWINQDGCRHLEHTKGFNVIEEWLDYNTGLVRMKFSSTVTGMEWSYEFIGKKIK